MNMPNDEKRRRGTIDKFEWAVNRVRSKNVMNSSVASTPCLRIKRSWRRRTHVLPTCAATFLTKRWTSLHKLMDQVGGLAGLQIANRIRVLRAVNKSLIEYGNDVGQDSQIRQ
jgi:hypothetical protein